MKFIIFRRSPSKSFFFNFIFTRNIPNLENYLIMNHHSNLLRLRGKKETPKTFFHFEDKKNNDKKTNMSTAKVIYLLTPPPRFELGTFRCQ
jgi:hypothetical protein